MAIERTLSIIKPDATERNLTGQIIARLEAAGLRVIGQKRIWWKRKDAKKFYEVHKGQPYYKDLIVFMTSGPIVVQVLEGEDAIAKNREVMGATNPANAAPGTIRKLFARSIEANSVHGSDSAENAKTEIAYFFSQTELVKYEWKR
jgi:nucleoside-diphosphate kinase